MCSLYLLNFRACYYVSAPRPLYVYMYACPATANCHCNHVYVYYTVAVDTLVYHCTSSLSSYSRTKGHTRSQSHLDDELILDGDFGIPSLFFLMLWNFILSLNESSHFPTFLAKIWPGYASGRFGNVACCLNFPNYVFNWTHYYTYTNCFPLLFAIFREWLMEMVCIFLY